MFVAAIQINKQRQRLEIAPQPRIAARSKTRILKRGFRLCALGLHGYRQGARRVPKTPCTNCHPDFIALALNLLGEGRY